MAVGRTALLLMVTSVSAVFDAAQPTYDQCNYNCPDSPPVCAINKFGRLQTFPSECMLRYHQCRFPAKGFRKISEGDCLPPFNPHTATTSAPSETEADQETEA
ncbi:uncharacterized protein LOC134529044 [Bacillus rossius redtenbacheri]|uniref:uncharacterized protein LOC134529044 n=1 Tax=Bacillus rossius redtenbacheri TaxID=93214 RepID=UPI002FDD40D5